MQLNKDKISSLYARIEDAEAIIVGAAAGMSAACGFNFFYQNDSYFQKYLGEFHKSMDISEHSMGSIIGIHPRRLGGHFFLGCAIWNMSAKQENRITT